MKSVVALLLAVVSTAACASSRAPTDEPANPRGETPLPASDPAPMAVGSPALCSDDLGAEACGVLRSLVQPVALPASSGSGHGDSFEASLFGFHLFFDARFSKNQRVRCESCHSVDHRFADGEAVPTAGVGKGVRNAPSILNVARHRTLLWDGRVDSLWSQPLTALENPDEMGSTRLEIVHLLNELYTKEYEKAFGPLFDFSDRGRFPAVGKPGDAAFDTMAPADQLEVNRAVANMGKALEAYMRRLASGPSLVDRYLDARFGLHSGYDPPRQYGGADVASGESSELLSQTQRHGMVVFLNAGCMSCHSGPQLSDDLLHNLGVPALPSARLDEGLSDTSLRALEASPFNAVGPFYEGIPEATPPLPVLGGFRTPSLRNLTKSAPYGHNGVFSTLEEVVDFHLSGGGKDLGSFVGIVDSRLVPHQLSLEDRAALIEFLKALDGEYPALPWGQWPSGNG